MNRTVLPSFSFAFLVGTVAFAVGTWPVHAADGVVDLSWGTCSPVVTDIAATSGPMSLVVSVTGNDQAHNAYQVRFLLADAQRNVPDAWRFDVAGCQGGSQALTINHLPPPALSKVCPAFQGPNASIQIRDYKLLSGSHIYPPTQIRGVLANTYPAGTTTSAAQRYFLAEFRFDHIWSVVGPGTPGETCGGLETPLCIALLTGPPVLHPWEGTTSYLGMDGVEVGFDCYKNWATVNGLTGCPRVPAAPATWGLIKSVYRR